MAPRPADLSCREGKGQFQGHSDVVNRVPARSMSRGGWGAGKRTERHRPRPETTKQKGGVEKREKKVRGSYRKIEKQKPIEDSLEYLDTSGPNSGKDRQEENRE